MLPQRGHALIEVGSARVTKTGLVVRVGRLLRLHRADRCGQPGDQEVVDALLRAGHLWGSVEEGAGPVRSRGAFSPEGAGPLPSGRTRKPLISEVLIQLPRPRLMSLLVRTSAWPGHLHQEGRSHRRWGEGKPHLESWDPWVLMGLSWA